MGKTDSGLGVGLELAVLARQLLPDHLHFFPGRNSASC